MTYTPPRCPKTVVWDIPGGPYRLECVQPAGHAGDCWAAELTREPEEMK